MRDCACAGVANTAHNAATIAATTTGPRRIPDIIPSRSFHTVNTRDRSTLRAPRYSRRFRTIPMSLDRVVSIPRCELCEAVIVREQPNDPPPSGGLLVAGTTSDAGKSTVVAALCRWLA